VSYKGEVQRQGKMTFPSCDEVVNLPKGRTSPSAGKEDKERGCVAPEDPSLVVQVRKIQGNGGELPQLSKKKRDRSELKPGRKGGPSDGGGGKSFRLVNLV